MRKYHRLTRENRYQIEALLRSKIGVRAISRVMGVAPSTISRELQKRGPGAYWAGHAHRVTQWRRRGVGPLPKIRGEIELAVIEGLEKKWSPEQIAGRLGLEQRVKLSAEAIYQYIYKDHRKGGMIVNRLFAPHFAFESI